MVDRGELYSAPYSQKKEASLTDTATAADLAQCWDCTSVTEVQAPPLLSELWVV